LPWFSLHSFAGAATMRIADAAVLALVRDSAR
jgi:hypothetical protein